MNYRDFNLGDWIGHISGVIEDETTLDGNEMRDLVEFLTTLKQEPTTKNNLGSDCISRQAVLDAFADYVGSGMSMNDFDALWDIVIKIQPVNPQEPKFIAKSDGTIEQLKNCEDCIFKKEWEKIGKLLSVVLEKQTEQGQNTGHWIEHEHNGIAHIECSECSSWFLRSHLVRNSYCPNCGAKMSETEGKE